MEYKGKPAVSETFRGKTLEDANAALLQGAKGRNILHVSTQVIERECVLVAIFERLPDRQILTEG